MSRSHSFAQQLAKLAKTGRLRRLTPRSGIDFSSNDYLGLSGDPVIAQAVADALTRGVRIGSGGSRLLRGNAPEHEALEAKAASFFGAEAVLFFPTGFAANQALLSTLPQRGDLVVADAHVHASTHEGLRTTRAEHVLVSHNDVGAYAEAIDRWRASGGRGRPWLVFETVYSMEGDVAPTAELAALADREDAWLIVDEAHATGLFGPSGRGFANELEAASHVIAVHTLGKALGVEGALVTGPLEIIEFLINRARPFIYSTAPSPLMAVAAAAALDRIAEADHLRTRLEDLRVHAAEHLCRRFGLPSPQSQIIPFILGSDGRTMAVAAAVQALGFDVRGIRPPTVPSDTGRLRISLTLNVDESAIEHLADALEYATKR